MAGPAGRIYLFIYKVLKVLKEWLNRYFIAVLHNKTFSNLGEMEEPTLRYEKIDFLGEGQVGS